MWLFTREGFFSVVQDKGDFMKLVVRTRRRGDLERLSIALNTHLDIIEGAGTDYQYRAVVDRVAFRDYMAEGIDGIDYTTGVKDKIDCGENDRHTAMYRVWSAMMSLQPVDNAWGSLAASYGHDGPTAWDDSTSRFDDYFDDADFDPDEFTLDEVVEVEYDELSETHDVYLKGANGDFVLIEAFKTQDQADRLANEVRRLLSTWDIGTTPHDDDPDDDIDDTTVEVGAALATALRKLEDDDDDLG